MSNQVNGAYSDYTKLIFWLLGALFLVMTAIGGSAAQRLVSQVDTLDSKVNVLQVQLATMSAMRESSEQRLIRIESKLDAVGVKQDFAAK